jgi:hypothetical protein
VAAARCGHFEVVRLILNHRMVGVNAVQEFYGPALEAAKRGKRHRVVNLLLGHSPKDDVS